MRKYGQAVLFGMLLVLLPGCASTRQTARIPDLSVPVEDATKARIYVVRPALIGSAVRMKVTDNDELIGKTGPRSYLVWERPPGDAFITSKAEKASSVALKVEAGKAYYILQRIEPGVWYARCLMEEIDEERGKKFIAGCKPAQQGN
jgi:hypothetical protein